MALLSKIRFCHRPASADPSVGARAPEQGACPGRVFARRAFVHCLCQPRDLSGTGGCRKRRAGLGLADRPGHRRAVDDGGPLLLSDHPRLSFRRRFLRRGPREPGHAARVGRGGSAVDRLPADRRRQPDGRCRGHRLGVSRAVALSRARCPCVLLAGDHLAQPAWHAGNGHPDVHSRSTCFCSPICPCWPLAWSAF